MTLDLWNDVDDFSSADRAAIERTTAEVGRYLFEHRTTRHMLQRRWWDERIMQWAMQEESVKVELFRFVDVLPMLHNSEAICSHLFEYLGQVRDRLPGVVSAALGVAQRNSVTRGAVARAARLSAMDLARRFIAGTNTQEVVEAARREREQGRGFTLDILGEAVASRWEAERFHQSYQRLIEELAPRVSQWPEQENVDQGVLGPLPRLNLSIKLSALDSQFDAIEPDGSMRRAGGRFRQLLRTARQHGAFINVDMESYAKKDLTLWIFQQVLMEEEFRDFGDVGIVIQCYLQDAARDLQQLRDWARRRGKPVWVRLVKGAYWDYEVIHARSLGWPIPVFQQKWQSDANFEQATRFVFRNHEHLRPALGTHNLRSMAHGIAVARKLGMPHNGFEIQMLYGMADREKSALQSLGHRLRIYMPYGELIPGMAYLVRRLLENTSNDSFLRAGLGKGVDLEELLASPAPGDPETRVRDRDLAAHTGGTGIDEETMTTSERDQFEATFANHPPIDFSKAENREAMEQALQQVLPLLGKTYPLWVGGQAIETPDTMSSVDPSHWERVVGEFSLARPDDVLAAVSSAKAALPAWRALGAAQRGDYIRQVAQVMRDRFFELAAWEVYECGKGWREATNDVCEAIDFCEFYAAAAEELAQTRGADVPGEENRFEYIPRGVVGVIAPWNFPLAILTGMTVAALSTGNTVIMKPAEQAAVVAAQLSRICAQVDLPAGVVNYLPGRGEVAGAALVEHPEVALLAFTGSRSVGLNINARAAEVSLSGAPIVKRVIAEMGGKNAIIVDSDADLDEAVLGVVKSAFGFQGQKCSACSRAIVLEEIYDAFLKRLVESARTLEVGPAEYATTDVGPVIDGEALKKVNEFIEIGRTEGREALAVEVDSTLSQRGYFVGPHIYADVAPDARVAQEEIFGPVLAVIRARDLDEAFEFANRSDYALTAGIYSRSPANLDRARRELAVGNLYLNRPITGALVGRQPFGGFKMSGIGSKAGSPDYLLQFVIPRTITENTMRRGFAPQVD